MLKATTTVPGLRNNIAGNEKTQAEAGGRPNYRPTGYSQANASSDGQRQYTLNGQVIQVLDIINPTNGFGGQTITNSNVRANHSNSTVVSVNEPAANGAGAFTIDHVVIILRIMQLMRYTKRSYTYLHMDQNNMLNI